MLAKFGTNAGGPTWWSNFELSGTTYNWPNFEPMQVTFCLAGEITQVKEPIPWVRCASGNVSGFQKTCKMLNSLSQFWSFAIILIPDVIFWTIQCKLDMQLYVPRRKYFIFHCRIPDILDKLLLLRFSKSCQDQKYFVNKKK